MRFDNRETRMKFIEAVRIARPDVMFAPPKHKNYNQNHDICGYLAFEVGVLATVKLMETEHPAADHLPPLFTCTAPGGLTNKTNPQYFVDITDTSDTKIKMVRCHASQVGAWPVDVFGVNYLEMIDAETKFYTAAC